MATKNIVPRADTEGGIGTQSKRWGFFYGIESKFKRIIIEDSDNCYIRLPRITTTQRNALTPANGMIIYNTTSNQFEKYENGSWKNLGDGEPVAWGSITGALSNQTDLKNALDNKINNSEKGSANGVASLDSEDLSFNISKIPISDTNGRLDNWISRVISILVSDPNGDAITVGDGKAYIRINKVIDGYVLKKVAAHVTTASTSGNIAIQIHNVTDMVDMLSTLLTIDVNEKDSKDAAIPAVINTDYDDVAEGDELRIDVDQAGTGAKGLIVDLTFEIA